MKSEIFYVLRFSYYEYQNGERVVTCNDELLDFVSYDTMISKIHRDLIRPHKLPFSLVHYELQYNTCDNCVYHRIVLDFNEWCSMLKRSYQYEIDKQRIEDECND